MLSNEDAVKAFRYGRTGNSRHIFHENSKLLYSYGYHFVLAVWMDQYYLINGDKYSVSTSAHTTLCIEHLCPHIIIPFSALRRIGWDNEKIRVVDTMPDVYIARKRWDAKTKEMVEYQEHRLGSSVFEFNGKFYLSSMDAGTKSGRSGYFLVELPGAVSNVEEAFDAIFPLDLDENSPYVRQGEFFFEPTDMPTRNLKPAPELYEWGLYNYETQYADHLRRPTKEETQRTLEGNLLSTPWMVHRFPIRDQNNLARRFPGAGTGHAHIVTELRYLDGWYYARGTVRHPEHKTLSLGKIWHRVYINNAVRSFNSDGNVD